MVRRLDDGAREFPVFRDGSDWRSVVVDKITLPRAGQWLLPQSAAGRSRPGLLFLPGPHCNPELVLRIQEYDHEASWDRPAIFTRANSRTPAGRKGHPVHHFLGKVSFVELFYQVIRVEEIGPPGELPPVLSGPRPEPRKATEFFNQILGVGLTSFEESRR